VSTASYDRWFGPFWCARDLTSFGFHSRKRYFMFTFGTRDKRYR
jgi:hypothetical protein